jgi:[pyruvate, water dikinase]-phosphate phosphotransferase / [pyruvate, water dikinase] kinase
MQRPVAGLIAWVGKPLRWWMEEERIVSKQVHLHLVSDATGETLHAVARASLAQFDKLDVQEHSHTLVRSTRQLARVVESIGQNKGLVFFTLVHRDLRKELISQLALMSVPYFDVMEGPIGAMQRAFDAQETNKPGGQHEVDQDYLQRIDALSYTIEHDDGQLMHDLSEAEVILLGASRTCKTPTCVYLAIRGIRAANVPLVPNMPPPENLFTYEKPLIIGLWVSPDRLVQVRINRLATMGEKNKTDYIDPECVRNEIMATRRLYDQHGWHSIDVTRRSVEETAATILNLLDEHKKKFA